MHNQVLDRLPGGVIALDRDLITYINTYALRTLGYPDLVGRSVHDILPPEHEWHTSLFDTGTHQPPLPVPPYARTLLDVNDTIIEIVVTTIPMRLPGSAETVIMFLWSLDPNLPDHDQFVVGELLVNRSDIDQLRVDIEELAGRIYDLETRIGAAADVLTLAPRTGTC